ncbi:sensor histidine kinase [Paenibacillus sp. sptzw28]|uniref:cache domain-containing sensor histidine kinase n=1 Tax=Paenibacillus sp. sptzw28 TaxID=715179 RepID=UPI001C6E094D|nr:sensor histidine kinase [Paenibacillus sp. sptzw28]QYR19669.1 sensor histidine kinase [Paenibacillus sp. sptzw28]
MINRDVRKGGAALVAMKALYNNLRIKYKLIALISAVMLTVGVLIVAVQQIAFEIYDEEIYQQSAKALNLTSFSIETELKKMEQLSFRLATDGLIQSYLTAIKHGGSKYDQFVLAAKIRERMVYLGGLDKYVLSLHMFDYRNDEYVTGVKQITTSSERAAVIGKETALRQGGNTWIHPDKSDGALSAARQIRSYDQLNLEALGMVAVRIDMSKLFADFAQGLRSDSAQFVIIDGEDAVYPEQPPVPVAELNSYMKSRQGYSFVSRGGKRYFLAYVPSGYTSWTYINVIPYDGIFEKIVNVKTTVFIIYSVLFLLAVLISIRFSKGITDPIERLNAKMKRVRTGNFEDFEEPDDASITMDEAGQLHRNFRMMVRRINDLIQENYVKQLAIKESDFKALQAQINPHFLYNTLETINWSAKMSRQPQISSMVESLGFLLRSSINLKEPLIPLRHELEIVGNYITIQQYRFEERLDFQLDVPENLLDCPVPKLSLQPLVENAVNYGLEQMIDTCTIRIYASEHDGSMTITVGDNGPGMDENFLQLLRSGKVKPQGSGVGLRNIDERIKLLFGEDFGLTVDSGKDRGTRVSLSLPFERGDRFV